MPWLTQIPGKAVRPVLGEKATHHSEQEVPPPPTTTGRGLGGPAAAGSNAGRAGSADDEECAMDLAAGNSSTGPSGARTPNSAFKKDDDERQANLIGLGPRSLSDDADTGMLVD